jgi:hypothetical protein
MATLSAPVAFILVFFTFAIIIYIQVQILRWIFKVDRHLLNQKAQIWLLIKLCENQGVPPEEIRAIMDINGIK